MSDARFRRLVGQLHACGPRALAEFLDELGCERLIRHPIEQKLRRYERLDPDVLRALGADRFATNPIRLVQKGEPPS